MARFALLGLCLMFFLVASLRASEADALRERAKAILKEAASLAEKGNKEEAEQLQARAKELLQIAEQREKEPKGADKKHHAKSQAPSLEDLERHLKDLLAKEHEAKQSKATEEQLSELRQHIAATKAKIDSLRSGQQHGADSHGPPPEMKQKLAEAVERLQHLRIAAEHLKAAGAVEFSRKVTEQAEQMEQDIRRAKEHLARAAADQSGSLPAQIEELRREMQRLRGEVEELRRQKLEK